MSLDANYRELNTNDRESRMKFFFEETLSRMVLLLEVFLRDPEDILKKFHHSGLDAEE